MHYSELVSYLAELCEIDILQEYKEMANYGFANPFLRDTI